MLENPGQRIDGLELLPANERARILGELSQAEALFSIVGTLPEHFEAQAVRTPDSTALITSDLVLTFGELNASANQLARYLIGLGIGPESRVGVMMERSAELLVGILGILKAGGVYVPLDPNDPRDRLAFMIADSEMCALLTQQSLRMRANDILKHGGFDDGQGKPLLLCTDEALPALRREPRDNPARHLSGDNAAYVIYTSGSTGRPKGVLTVQRGVINHNRAFSQRFGLGRDDRVLQFHSIGFDAAVEEIFPTWFSGGAIVLRGEELPSPRALMELVTEQQVTVLDLPTAYWHTWVQELSDGSALPALSIRLVVVGGEKASAERFQTWQRKAGQIRWANTYGPTETTVIATAFEPSKGFYTDDGLPIGRPIANTETYLLNSAMQLMAVGVPGELYLGGPCVARGYLREPALTAERFVPKPFASGARLYKTGDVARYRPNGEIDFLGRRDDQVKVRGFRVEPGEIESVLSRHPQVREAVVVASLLQGAARQSTDMQLLGYVTTHSGVHLEGEELRLFLRARLPEFMIPRAIVTLDSLPMTPTGKVNRRALQDIRGSELTPNQQLVAPRTPVEERIADIWKELLDLRHVGVYDNFFELGGHSLLATQVIARIEKQFPVAIPLRRLFESPTVAKLAELVEENPATVFSSLVPIQERGSQLPFFCVHPVQGTVLSYYNLSRHMGTDQPFYGLQARGLHETPPEYRSIEVMAADYIQLIREIQPAGPYRLGGWSIGGVVAMEMAQQIRQSGEQVAALALIDSYTPRASNELQHELNSDTAAEFLKKLGLSKEELEGIMGLEPEAQVASVLSKLQRANMVADEVTVHHALLGWHIRNAAVRYQPSRYEGRTLLLKAGESSHKIDPNNGWSAYIGEHLEARTMPGTHFTIVEEPHVRAVAAALTEFLTRSM